MPTSRTRHAAVLLAAALLATACSGSSTEAEDSPAASTTTGTEAAEETSAAEPAPDGELAEAARVAGVDPANPPEPIASTTMPAAAASVPVARPTTMRVDLISLRRQDDLLVLTVGFTPEGDGNASSSYFGWTGNTYSPSLIDTENLKKHSVVDSDDGSLVTGTGAASTQIGSGQTLYTYAVFAAPPEGVTTMTVSTGQGAMPFTDVKIQ